MNTPEEAILVLQAFAAGKQLQVRNGYEKWVDRAGPATKKLPNFSDHEYRIKPLAYWLVTFFDPRASLTKHVTWYADSEEHRTKYINEIRNRQGAKLVSIIEVNGDDATVLPNP